MTTKTRQSHRSGSGHRWILTVASCALMATAVAGESPVPEGRQLTAEGRLIPLDAKTREIAALAHETLAAELSVDPARVQVDTVQAMQWGDTSLGCPAPGFGYAQVITAGYRVTLQVGGERHLVHTNTGTRAVVCKGKRSPGGEPRSDGKVPSNSRQ